MGLLSQLFFNDSLTIFSLLVSILSIVLMIIIIASPITHLTAGSIRDEHYFAIISSATNVIFVTCLVNFINDQSNHPFLYSSNRNGWRQPGAPCGESKQPISENCAGRSNVDRRRGRANIVRWPDPTIVH